MARDYKKNNRHHSGKTNSGLRPVFLVLLSLFIGYFSASLYSPKQFGQWVSKKIELMNQKEKPANSTYKQKKVELPKPKFEFYTLLTDSKTNNKLSPHQEKSLSPKALKPQQGEHVPVEKAKPSAAIKKSESNFIIQVASFKSKADADRLKATLTIKGYDTSIQTIKQKNTYWYRVLIGPYTDRVKAERAQVAVARSEHVMGMIRKQDV